MFTQAYRPVDAGLPACWCCLVKSTGIHGPAIVGHADHYCYQRTGTGRPEPILIIASTRTALDDFRVYDSTPPARVTRATRSAP